jgi:phosphotransferase system enzyme I (PtsP)
LRVLKEIADKSRAHGKLVTLCGELASKPIGALALVAIGYRSLSLTPSAVGPVKALILDLDAGKAAALLTPLLTSPAGSVRIRERLEAFAEEHGLQL